jgi:hypothetical protein
MDDISIEFMVGVLQPSGTNRLGGLLQRERRGLASQPKCRPVPKQSVQEEIFLCSDRYSTFRLNLSSQSWVDHGFVQSF